MRRHRPRILQEFTHEELVVIIYRLHIRLTRHKYGTNPFARPQAEFRLNAFDWGSWTANAEAIRKGWAHVQASSTKILADLQQLAYDWTETSRRAQLALDRDHSRPSPPWFILVEYPQNKPMHHHLAHRFNEFLANWSSSEAQYWDRPYPNTHEGRRVLGLRMRRAFQQQVHNGLWNEFGIAHSQEYDAVSFELLTTNQDRQTSITVTVRGTPLENWSPLTAFERRWCRMHWRNSPSRHTPYLATVDSYDWAIDLAHPVQRLGYRQLLEDKLAILEQNQIAIATHNRWHVTPGDQHPDPGIPLTDLFLEEYRLTHSDVPINQFLPTLLDTKRQEIERARDWLTRSPHSYIIDTPA